MKAETNKRILFLGSNVNVVTLVQKAKDMGLYTLVTDYTPYEKAPAKHIADEYADISIADIDAVAEFIYRKNIDGVLTGFSDSYLQYYQAVCEKTGLPCYGNGASFKIATDKNCFKKVCLEHHIGVIPGGVVKTCGDAVALASELGFPVMLKPIDNSGSRGVIRCDGLDEMKRCFEYAVSFSVSKSVMCEKYMDCNIFTASYQLIEGRAYLALTGDRTNYVAKADGSSVAGISTYPSRYTDRYIAEVDANVKKMLANNGFQNGIASFQAFVDEKGFYMCEMCYRPSGGQHYILIEDQCGLNGLELLIEYAVNGYVKWDREINPFFKELCAGIRIIGKPGEQIATFDGIDTIRKMENIIAIHPSLNIGDKIGKDGTTAQKLASVWCKAENINSLERIYNEIIQTMDVKNSRGESLVLPVPYFDGSSRLNN